MLWFNAEKDLGALLTDDGERIEFSGSAFAPGERPTGRCAGLPVKYERADDVVGIVFVPEAERRRARRRSR